LSEPELLNALNSIDAILQEPIEPLETECWEQSDDPSLSNLVSIEATMDGRGISVNDPVFGEHWTKYLGLHFGWFTNCDPEETLCL
jgi:hypothetical protein